MLLAGEDSPPPKKRSVGEASEGEEQVVDKPANTKKTKWPPKSTQNWSAVIVRPSLMESELRCQNFDLVKFREIILRNPCYGTFFSQNFESEFSNNSDPPAEPKLE